MPDTPQPAPEDATGDYGSVVEFPGAPEGERPPNNLPLELSSFVGREREISEVEALLLGQRLLTLTGPGGSGKTRLALRVASEVVGSFEDGVWLMEFAPLSDPDLLGQTVASVLGVREAPGEPLLQTLADGLRSRSLLLVLDNCEHLVEACAALAETLLRSCPKVRILATSREMLGVGGEALFAVPPLSLPDPRRPPAAEGLSTYEAARLFVERARTVKRDFSLTEQNALAVAQVCHRLDGIPLAIELAAARMRVLSVGQISERLKESFGLLSGGGRRALAHQRTLRATMDWSYGLLPEDERVAFRRLSVFAGGWTLGAVEAVCTDGGLERREVLDLLTHLVDKSLVLVAERDGGARYRLLETLRQYGQERLEESEDAGPVEGRHARYYLALAEEAERESSGPDRPRWLARLEAEHDNLRAALRRLLKGRDDELLGLRLAAALWSFWYTRGHLGEGRRWLEDAIFRHKPATDRTMAKALGGAGYIALFQGDYEAAKEFLERSLALCRGLTDKEGIASALIYLGFVAVLGERDLEAVPALYEEASVLGPELEDPRVVANLALFSGLIAISQAEMERARILHEEALALFRQIGDIQGLGHCLNNLALLALIRADYDGASVLIQENLRMAQESDYKLAILYSLLGLGIVAAFRGQPVRAARLWGSVETMEEASGIGITPLARSSTNYDAHLSTARSRLGVEAFEAALAEGRAMTPEVAIEYALKAPRETLGTPSVSPTYPAGLSAREVDVLRLLTRGMTNANIARELYISPRTVNGHLRSVYYKIGTSTRAEAARFASENRLI